MAISASDFIASSNYALAMKRFAMATDDAYYAKARIVELFDFHEMGGAKTESDLVVGGAGRASQHDPGTAIVGEALSANERLITLEDKETMKSFDTTKPEELVNHTDKMTKLGTRCGEAIALDNEIYGLQNIILGARTAAAGVRKAGFSDQKSDNSTEARYPLTLAGSVQLQDDLAEIAQEWREREVDINGDDMHAILTPYLHRVLRKDTSLQSLDYVDRTFGDRVRAKLTRTENFWIHVSNNVPSTNVTTGPDVLGTDAYTGNFSDTMFCAFKEGAITMGGTPMDHWFNWESLYRKWNIGAGFLRGFRINTPAHCAELRFTAP